MSSRPRGLPRLPGAGIPRPGGDALPVLDLLALPGGRRVGTATGLAVLAGVLAATVAAGLPAGWVLFALLTAGLTSSELRARSLAHHLAARAAVRRPAAPLRLAVGLVERPWTWPGAARPGILTIEAGVARLELADGRPGGFVARVHDVHLTPWRLRAGPALELATPAGSVRLAALAHPDLAGWALPCLPLLAELVGYALGTQRRLHPTEPDPAATPVPPFDPPGAGPRLAP